MGVTQTPSAQTGATTIMKKKVKNPPFFSHEFVIQNHADIVACVAMVFVVGLMFQVSSSLASVFIVMQHNTTAPVETMPGVFQDLPFYTAGLRDIPAVFFYLLISVVMHAIIQEYLLDEVNKKLHLSKVKYNKFNESGQLLAFYLVSLFWGGDLLLRENLLSVSSIWEGYPHNNMTFLFKFYFIIQISYWLHIFPELYFQKTKKEEMPEKTSISNKLFKLGDLLFVLARFSSVILSVLTFWFGLAKLPTEQQSLDVSGGNFNTGLIRLNSLIAVYFLQAWLMWNFIVFQFKRARETKPTSSSSTGSAGKKGKTEQEKAKARKAKKEQEDSDLPEVDQKKNK